MICNLGVPWNEPGTIGDIQAITPDQQFGMAFVTGPGRYRLDFVTFEHIKYSGPLQNFRVQIYRFGPLETAQPPAWPLLLHGQFSNPTVDPRPTQWPAWTKFATYSPNTTITLEANSKYLIAIKTILVLVGLPTRWRWRCAKTSLLTRSTWAASARTSATGTTWPAAAAFEEARIRCSAP